jgi:beta-glucosidase
MSTPHAVGSDFLWGTATASYQIEGGFNADGKGPSIWDTFAHTPGRIERDENGDVADDHYHLWQHDLDIMAELGMRAYRFSLAWARVLPEGRGQANVAGLDFYDRLVDGLLERKIVPFVTLYHWDLPQALEDRGGWQNRDTAYRFQDYADLVTRRLGDRVQNWITLNEPYISADHGYVAGEHAPGIRNLAAYLPVSHHLMLAHGLALQPIRANVPASKAGIAFSLPEIQPASDRDEDIAAAQRADDWMNGVFLSSTLRGNYPIELAAHLTEETVHAGDMDIISGKTDLIGINYYMRLLAHAQKGNHLPGFEIPDSSWPPGPRTEMDWEMYPQGLGYWIRRMTTEAPEHDLYITENGAAFPDEVQNGMVHDPQRIAYLRDHVNAALEARSAVNARLKGYFVWSFMDNFEWARGFRPRFGLVYVDYATRERIVKASGRWYAEVIRSGAPDDA